MKAPRMRGPLGAVLAGVSVVLIAVSGGAGSAGAATNGPAHTGKVAATSQGGVTATSMDEGPHYTQDNPPEPASVYDNNHDISIPNGNCAMFAFNGSNRTTRNFAYGGMPGTNVQYGDDLNLSFIPGCDSPRDFIVGTGILTNAIGEPVGDRPQPAPGDAPAYTRNGTPVWVTLRVDWEVNLSERALRSFWKSVCVKFICNSYVKDPDNPPGLGRTSSTKGWLRWQGELMGPAIDSLVTQFMNNYSDKVITDAKLQVALGNQISQGFAVAFEHSTGQSLPLLCGPGTSFWVNMRTDNYHCSPVRVWDLHVIPDSQMHYELGVSTARQLAECKFLLQQCTMVAGKGGLVLQTGS